MPKREAFNYSTGNIVYGFVSFEVQMVVAREKFQDSGIIYNCQYSFDCILSKSKS